MNNRKQRYVGTLLCIMCYALVYAWYPHTTKTEDISTVVFSRESNFAAKKTDIKKYYNTRMQTPVWTDAHIPSVQKQIQELITEKNIQCITYLHAPSSILEFSDLSLVQLAAIFISLRNSSSVGYEMDLVLSLPESKQAISVIWEHDNCVYLSKNKEYRENIPPMTAEEIKQQYSVGEFENVDKEWTESEISYIGYALGLLSPEERTYIKKIPFQRKGANNNQSGLYAINNEKDHIEIYDAMFSKEIVGFIGDIENPYPNTIETVIHEIGHTILQAESMDNFRKLQKVSKEHNSLVATYNRRPDVYLAGEIDARADTIKQLQKQDTDTILKDFLAHRSQNKGPTDYGDVADKEAFAESFMLYKLDPKALERIDSTLFAWFASNQHLYTLRTKK